MFNVNLPSYNTAFDRITPVTELGFQQDFLNQQMAFNSAEAEKNREFQREMSNTAYQRMAEDLKKAGFNPALVLNGGGASTPTGSLATSSLATAPALTSGYISLVNNKTNASVSYKNNLITNAFNLLNTQIKTTGQAVSSLVQSLGSLLG